jgi:hypothetical protein
MSANQTTMYILHYMYVSNPTPSHFIIQVFNANFPPGLRADLIKMRFGRKVNVYWASQRGNIAMREKV